jgi:glycosyltransferase involved in cell wall biosynthesis
MTVARTVSIIIPVRNGAGTISDTLAALRSQVGTPSNTEVIVVDNGSTDDTTQIVRRFDVTLLSERKPGPSAARNRGLTYATGDIIACVDADTIPSRRWLGEMVAGFDDPAVMLVGGRTVCFPLDTPAEQYVAQSGLYDTERAISRNPFPFVPSLNMAVRCCAALDVGGWAEDLVTGEDVDFSYRVLIKHPNSIAYRPNAVLFHRARSSDESLRRQAWAYGQGVAVLYHRYPTVARWNAAKAIHVITRLGLLAAWQVVTAAAHRMSCAPASVAQFARYKALWMWWFWRGFFRRFYERDPAAA